MSGHRFVTRPHSGFGIGVLVAVFCAALVSCKQGRGDRCQIDDDCSQGLICNKATDTCQETGGGGDIDATVPDELTRDAAVETPVDASPQDAPVDPPVDPPPSGPT